MDYLARDTYNFFLPEELIAIKPEDKRDHCRLMTLNKTNGETNHLRFDDIKRLISKDDLLVLNNSKVIPARIFAKKTSGGIVEILLLKKINNDDRVWETLIRGKNVKLNDTLVINFRNIKIECVVSESLPQTKIMKFSLPLDKSLLTKIGKIPLPPYIIQRRKKENVDEYFESDKENYQNVYAKIYGSVASPTSGLHFTNELLDEIKNIGVTVCSLTLHIGFSTFVPLKEERLDKHIMHSESFNIPEATAKIITEYKKDGRKIISCGTTAARVLESEYDKNKNTFRRLRGETNIFLYPPYQYKCVDKLITNFHTPNSTLLAMVSAFAGYDNIIKAYSEAIDKRYRFFSYGDAMFIY